MPVTVTVVDHPLVADSLARIRDRETPNSLFRTNLERIGTLLLAEATRSLRTVDGTVDDVGHPGFRPEPRNAHAIVGSAGVLAARVDPVPIPCARRRRRGERQHRELRRRDRSAARRPADNHSPSTCCGLTLLAVVPSPSCR